MRKILSHTLSTTCLSRPSDSRGNTNNFISEYDFIRLNKLFQLIKTKGSRFKINKSQPFRHLLFTFFRPILKNSTKINPNFRELNLH